MSIPILTCATIVDERKNLQCGHTIPAHIKKKVGGQWKVVCRVQICPCTDFALGGVNNAVAERNAFLSEKKD